MKTILVVILTILTLGVANVSQAGNGQYDGFWVLSTNEIIIVEEYNGRMVTGLLSGFERTSWWAYFGQISNGSYQGYFLVGRNAGAVIELVFYTPHTGMFIVHRYDGLVIQWTMHKATF